jgi:hypothetical protein
MVSNIAAGIAAAITSSASAITMASRRSATVSGIRKPALAAI